MVIPTLAKSVKSFNVELLMLAVTIAVLLALAILNSMVIAKLRHR